MNAPCDAARRCKGLEGPLPWFETYLKQADHGPRLIPEPPAWCSYSMAAPLGSRSSSWPAMACSSGSSWRSPAYRGLPAGGHRGALRNPQRLQPPHADHPGSDGDQGGLHRLGFQHRIGPLRSLSSLRPSCGRASAGSGPVAAPAGVCPDGFQCCSLCA